MGDPARRGIDWCGVAGIAFVVLTIAIPFVMNDLDSHRPRADFVDYYGDFRGSAHEAQELLANLIAVLAAFCFAWFLRRLRDLIRPTDAGLAALAVGGGFVFVTLLLAAVVAFTAVGTTIAYSDDYAVDIDSAILLSNVGLFLYTAAGGGAAVLVWATSLAGRRGAILPGWLAWGGFVVAVGCLAIIALDGLAVILLLAWVLVVSVLMLRRPVASDSTQAVRARRPEEGGTSR